MKTRRTWTCSRECAYSWTLLCFAYCRAPRPNRANSAFPTFSLHFTRERYICHVDSFRLYVYRLVQLSGARLDSLRASRWNGWTSRLIRKTLERNDSRLLSEGDLYTCRQIDCVTQTITRPTGMTSVSISKKRRSEANGSSSRESISGFRDADCSLHRLNEPAPNRIPESTASYAHHIYPYSLWWPKYKPKQKSAESKFHVLQRTSCCTSEPNWRTYQFAIGPQSFFHEFVTCYIF